MPKQTQTKGTEQNRQSQRINKPDHAVEQIGGQRVIIATRNGRVPPTGDGHGASNLVLHEVGHALDAAVSGSDEAEFQRARTADLTTLDAYERQAGRAGLEETFAESLARYYGGDPADARAHPNLHQFWQNFSWE